MYCFWSVMVVHDFNTSTLEAEASGSLQILGQPGLDNKTRSYLNNNFNVKHNHILYFPQQSFICMNFHLVCIYGHHLHVWSHRSYKQTFIPWEIGDVNHHVDNEKREKIGLSYQIKSI